MANGRIHHRPGDYQKQGARLLEIDRLVRARGFPSQATLAAHLGVTVRTIQRDFDHLKETLRAPLAYDGHEKGWCYTEESYFLPAVVATEGDVLSLLLVREAVEQYASTPHAEAARAALAKVEAALPGEARVTAAWVEKKVAFTGFPAAEIRPRVWQDLLSALAQSRTLRIRYRKPGVRAAWRKLDPWGLIVSEGDWYVHGYCHRSAAPRTFLLPRIRESEVTAGHFEVPASFDLAAYVRTGFAGLHADGEPEATWRIRFSPEASPAAAERRWHPDQRASRDARGRLTLTIRTSAAFRLLRRVAEWGDGVEEVERVDEAEILRPPRKPGSAAGSTRRSSR
jgi:predicted DNA-binding transcriptional regulator YafY